MPYYHPIRQMPKTERLRTIAGLQRLRQKLDAEMPEKTRDATLILGTWNIRNFDDNRFGNGMRSQEDLYYLAEIIARFDVLAVQEICDDLAQLDELMKLLGPDYTYVLTDVTEGPSGNDERLGFIFDKDKVKFKGVAGELVLSEKLQIMDAEKKRQFARTPFMCAFQSGWFKFMFSTVHIYFGASGGTKYRRRVNEIGSVAKFLAKRAKNADANHILVGDFNIVKEGSKGHDALTAAGFETVKNDVGSNAKQTHFYDQISFLTRKGELQVAPSDRAKGVFQFFDAVFRKEDFKQNKVRLQKTIDEKVERLEADIVELKERHLKSRTAKSKAARLKDIKGKQAEIKKWKTTRKTDALLQAYYMDDWRTFHASDHLPLWVELEIDFSEEFLQGLAT